jgi:hypothetical protein
MACPASVTLTVGRTRPSSKYAREGTAAHSIAEKLLEGDMFPPGRLSVDGDEFIVGRDMLLFLRPYVDLVEDYRAKGFQIHTEQRVALSISNGLVWGTADCVATKRGQLAVVDLKYGRGVPVSPDSAQLKIYALGGIESLWNWKAPKDWVSLTVVQPRLDPLPQTVDMTVGDLLDWSRDELEPAVERLVMGDTTENAGPHCRWCVRQAECAAFASKKSGLASESFDDGLDLTKL